MNWQNVFLVIIGSGLGGACRYIVSQLYTHNGYGAKFFLSTFTVNIVGSLLIGIVFALMSKGLVGDKGNLLIVTGFMGGFTTFSSFSLDSLKLLQQGEITTAIFYAFGSLFLGLLFVFIGYWLGKSV